ncbi:hypothetical protein BCV72DRAFT_251502 [Rhizopus microsporus var. microsporus]|uniref:P-loop containing nucleoside triphosphate hydrolase protein n=1 Tax=Rhizopus microsporus var. microsporus TaxID=86635 RepID=A0A1X0QWA2_RHIZD|nr:hypothetical protein BCV72DRAFT_251502 [Rhizopus microsporus var. microsporus]
MNTTSEPSTRDGSVEVDTPGTSATTPSMIGDHELENIPEIKEALVTSGLSESIVEEEVAMAKKSKKEEDQRMKEEAQNQFDSAIKEQRMKRLHFLLEKSGAYATILGRKLERQQEEARERAAQIEASETPDEPEDQPKRGKSRRTRAAPPLGQAAKKRKITDADYQLTDYIGDEDIKKSKVTDGDVNKAIMEEENKTDESKIKPTISARQPALVTGGVLRDYQLAGVEWLISLWENGLNGILADEMGLGKTLQTISFIAHLKSMKVAGPYLIVAPLSTLANWVNEFKRFTPTINVLLYHGTKEERQHMINRKMSKKKETSFEFPVIVTSYEIVMNDRTPLQNNLAELWSLLNFLLPDIFDDLDMFQSWFDFSDINNKSGQDRIIKEEEEDKIVTSLHTILKPFLLRRLKTDVEHSLPKKKEYLLYAPLTQPQKNLYDAIIKRDLRDYLLKRKISLPDKEQQDRRATKAIDYKEKSDRQYFAELEKKNNAQSLQEESEAKLKRAEFESAVKQVNSLHLQNLVMQLRKVCNHPFLFDWPLDPKTNAPVLNNDLAAQSGKVLLLDRLLTALFERGHKVLVFSQMTKMLDILEDWATDIKGWKICRLDGSVPQESRRQQIEEFSDPKSDTMLFLLSTRAGGLGINLTAADTVVIFDSDWNPQMDLQAQDRVHRIGQTKPVLIYRLVAAKTVEAKILEKATAKRRLEKLVISKGKFKSPVSADGNKKQESSVRELAEILASEDGEQVQIVAEGDKVISDADLEKLLDRSPSVFETKNTSETNQFREMDSSELQDTKNEILATRS